MQAYRLEAQRDTTKCFKCVEAHGTMWHFGDITRTIWHVRDGCCRAMLAVRKSSDLPNSDLKNTMGFVTQNLHMYSESFDINITTAE